MVVNRFLLILCLLVQGTPMLWAQSLLYLSATRSIRVSGWSQLPPGNPTNFASSDAPAVPFQGFSSTVQGVADLREQRTNEFGDVVWAAAYASSTASQSSTFQAEGMEWSARLEAVAGGSFQPVPQWVFAEAESVLETTFRVSQPVSWELEFDNLFYLATPQELTLSLASDVAGSVLGMPHTRADGQRYYCGQMAPDQNYTLRHVIRLDADIPDPLRTLRSAEAALRLVIVPEPSAAALLLGGLAFLCRRRFANHGGPRSQPGRAGL